MLGVRRVLLPVTAFIMFFFFACNLDSQGKAELSKIRPIQGARQKVAKLRREDKSQEETKKLRQELAGAEKDIKRYAVRLRNSDKEVALLFDAMRAAYRQALDVLLDKIASTSSSNKKSVFHCRELRRAVDALDVKIAETTDEKKRSAFETERAALEEEKRVLVKRFLEFAKNFEKDEKVMEAWQNADKAKAKLWKDMEAVIASRTEKGANLVAIRDSLRLQLREFDLPAATASNAA